MRQIFKCVLSQFRTTDRPIGDEQADQIVPCLSCSSAATLNVRLPIVDSKVAARPIVGTIDARSTTYVGPYVRRTGQNADTYNAAQSLEELHQHGDMQIETRTTFVKY